MRWDHVDPLPRRESSRTVELVRHAKRVADEEADEAALNTVAERGGLSGLVHDFAKSST
jgi:hypothetical protein